MKLKIITLLLLFSFGSFSSLAVVDTKERVQTERIQNIKKRKFRLRDLFQWKKKIKKPRKENTKKISVTALISFICGVLGMASLLLIFANTVWNPILLTIGLKLVALTLGILSLLGPLKNNPEQLKGKWMAWIGIGLSVLFGCFILFLIFGLP